MNDNINGGQLFTYNSPSSSSPATAAATSSYSSLNNHFNQKQMGYLTMEKDPWKHESSSMLLNAADDAENKINIRKPAEKKIKKPKHAFQTRSQVDILDDGYRWRKYGQKAVKNNKFPRNYYRCTHEGCNVKKQVQRLSNDEGIVVTTYEGVHSHPIEKSTDNFENILTQMQIYPG